MAEKLPKKDVVIVGVGWAGGIIASELTKKGYDVIGLERGKDRDMADYLHGHDELRYSTRKEMMQDLSKDTVTFRNHTKMTALPMRQYGAFYPGDGVGGAGAHWNGQTYRFGPYDFEIRSKTIERYGEGKIPNDMPIQDWGITYDELQPYFEKFEGMAGIGGQEDEGPMAPPRRAVFEKNGEKKKYPVGPMKVSPMMKMFMDATTELGYNPYIVPTANLTEAYTNEDGISRAACQYCAFCEHYGCEYGAKADPVVTVLPVAKQTGKFTVRPHSTVIKVLHTDGKASGVVFRDTITGEEFIQEADVVVLTSYVFNNVRLLLNSKLGKPYNPETQTGVVGKNYCYQVQQSGASLFFEDKEFNSYAGAGALGAVIDDFNCDNFDHSDVDFLHGGALRVMQTGKRPIATNPVPPIEGLPGWGKEWKAATLKWYHRNVSIGGQGASLPNRYNYLDLDPTYTDDYGMPLIRMTFNYHDQDKKLSKYLAEKAEEIGKKMNATYIKVNGLELGDFNIANYQSTHNTGGVIMGNDPETSAVNSYLQMWDADNVFVVGASAFPHNSGYNPTATVGALAYRAAEGIEKFIKEGGSLV